MENPLEIVDIISENDSVLYQTTKQEAHEKGLLHRCVIGLVINSNNEYVLVKQSSSRQDAGQYVCPIGGHVSAGETYEEALKREAEEEIGIKTFESKEIGTLIFDRVTLGRKENHFCKLYEVYSDEAFVLGEEASEYKSFSEEELKRVLKGEREIMGDSLLFQFEKLYTHLLV